MRVVEVKRLIGKGSLAPSPEWRKIRDNVIEAIKVVDWPPGSGKFTINPRLHGNGVRPIQQRAATLLNDKGWTAQYPWPIADRSQPGRMDAAYDSTCGLVAFEWENRKHCVEPPIHQQDLPGFSYRSHRRWHPGAIVEQALSISD